MPMIKVAQFGGMVPLIDSHLLPDYHAAYAQNCFVQAGTLRPFAALTSLYTMKNPNNTSFFRVPQTNIRTIDDMQQSYWLEFPLQNTWVVRNPTSELDDDGRYYWADGTNAPGMTTGTRLANGQAPLVLGIPAPEVAPGVTTTGGGTTNETRSYVYTWISASGEEGPPSPPTVLSGPVDAVWNITFTPPTTSDNTNRTLQTLRLYRTVTSSSGVASFYRVVDLPIATTTYADTIPDGTVTLNDTLLSTNWSAPPSDINGLVALPNGMIAGFRAPGEIWFCEPYLPHAWPPQYMLAVEGPIVGLGVQQQSLVILTQGWNYIATGINPGSMVLAKVTNLEPCTSMGSIVSSPIGVLYTSNNGLINVNSGMEVNTTANLVRKDEWPKLLFLPNLHACYINRSYLAFSSPNSSGVFDPNAFQIGSGPTDSTYYTFQTIDFTGTQAGALISINDERAAFMPVQTPIDPTTGRSQAVQNIMQDVWTGEPLALLNGVVYHLDVRQATPRINDYLWRSKIFQSNYKENWAAAKVFFGPPPGVTGTPDAPTYFRFYADGNMIFQRPLDVSGKQFRLPSGYKSDMIQFELQGQLEVFNVQIATSPHELRNA